MTLPVSSYEELLVQVRELTHETILLQRQLSSDLLNNATGPTAPSPDVNHNFAQLRNNYEHGKFLPGNSMKRYQRDRQNEISHTSLSEYNNLRLQSRFCQSFAATDGIRSEDLTNRLLAWKREINCLSSQEDETTEDRQDHRARGDFRRRVSSDSRQEQYRREPQELAEEEEEEEEEGGGGGGGLNVVDDVGAEKVHPRFAWGSRRRRRFPCHVGPSHDVATPLAGQEAAAAPCMPPEEESEVVAVNDDAVTAAAAAAAVVAGVETNRSKPTANVLATLSSSSSSSTSSTSTSSSSSSTAAVVRCARVAVNRALDATTDAITTVYLPAVAIDTNKEDAMEPEVKERDERSSSTPSPEFYMRRHKYYNEEGSSEEDNKADGSSLQNQRLPSSYRGTWPIRRDVWANQQLGFATQQSTPIAADSDMASVMSFSSNSGGTCNGGGRVSTTEMQGQRRLGAKMDVVYNLLGMLSSTEGQEDMSTTLLWMSNSIESCLMMRQSGCLPLLVQLIHAPGQDQQTRERASRALHNVVHAKSEERAGRREARVLRFLEQLRDYCQSLRTSLEMGRAPDDQEKHPSPTIAALMKLSFDEAHRHAMCQLGGLHAVAELIEMDHLAHGSECDDPNCITLRRYAGMALTNLTFGDGNNKALLCSFREFMKALVSQLRSPSDDLRQVTASVLRNLSWRADDSSKQTLREVGAVTGLMKAAMEGRKESALKSILSALWNLSAHCSPNKVDICAADGALAFLVDMLSYKAPSKTLAIVENAGGILRNVSSYIAVRDDYRAIIREKGCLQVLLQQLRSPSLTVVSNACGALWNLSARCPQDQRLLWDLGAVPMLRSLVYSKHKMISMGSSAALKNLLSARPGSTNLVHLDSTTRGLGLPTLPTLMARRQKALEQEIEQNLAETCDNIEPSTSPTNKDDKVSFKDHSFLGTNARIFRSYQLHCNQPGTSTGKCNGVARSESRESMRSITSTHSDTMFERVNRHVLNGMSPTDFQIKQQSSSLHAAIGFCNNVALPDTHRKLNTSEKKYTQRYKNALTDHRLKPSSQASNDVAEFRCMNSTTSWSSAADQEAGCSQMLLHSSVEDNLSLINRSFSSTSKAESHSSRGSSHEDQSLSEDAETTVRTKAEYADNKTRSSDVTSTSLTTIRKAVSPTMSHTTDGDFFGDYAETDLDQPTDYSLRYAEQTVEEEKHEPGYFSNAVQTLLHEDTVKTYCTEGTPHETSLNSSRAASTSDLQDDCRTKNLSKKVFERSKLKDVQSYQEGLNGAQDGDESKSSKDVGLEKEGEKLIAEEISVYKKYEQGEVNARLPRTNDTEHSHESIEQVSDGDEDDEDLLAACINIGMQNNRHRHSFIGNSFEKLPRSESTLTRYQTSTALDQVECDATCDAAGVKTKESPEKQLESPKFDADHFKENNRVSEKHIQASSSMSQLYAQSEAPPLATDQHKMSLVNEETESDDGVCIADVSTKSNPNYFTFTKSKKKATRTEAQSDDAHVDSSSHTKTSDDGSFMEATSLTVTSNIANEGECDVTINAATCDRASLQRSYMKITDSESNESFDSVEQSEHTLLKLCIQSGEPKCDDGVAKDGASPTTYDKSQERYAFSTEDTTRSTKAQDVVDSKESGVKGSSGTKTKSSCDDAKHTEEDAYRRQRDPDAMIASLDRLTATLVQQTEAMRERDSSVMKQSNLSDTWNEDSPNDGSFPSISISAPLIGSFRSDVPEDQVTLMSDIIEAEDETLSMTNSRIIEREAIKLANAVKAEANDQNELELAGTTSIDLEAINPPSSMGSLVSLTTSYAGLTETNESFVNRDRCNSTSLPPLQTLRLMSNRKKSLPVGVVAKRALGHGQGHTASLENLLKECTNSHLENVKPPSVMDELLDGGDMENSMLSVASITSEVADPKDQDSSSLTGSDPVFDLLKPVANVLSITCMRYAEAMQSSANNSLSECLENINPPSLFNEVSEMDESTVEATTDTMCSDTICPDIEIKTEEVGQSVYVGRIAEESDTDEAVTPLSSEYCVSSSAESTPRKRLNKSMTPKQKRNLAKERYKTYVIAAEIVKKEEEERRKQETPVDAERIPRGKCSPFSKLTPKQRRQEDRARFQTQVLENPFPDMIVAPEVKEDDVSGSENADKAGATQQAKSAIPTLKKSPGLKELRKKRAENDESKDRYRTRTLTVLQSMLRENGQQGQNVATIENENVTVESIESEEIRVMLEQNATIVLNTLNESSKVSVPAGDDSLLDCETISLVSLDSEPEKSLKMRLTNGFPTKPSTQQVNVENKLATYTVQCELPASLENDDGNEIVENSGDSQSEDEGNLTGDQPQLPKRPRIIKPGMGSRDQSVDSNLTDKSDPESPKAIRGRRKALYSNPITRRPTPQSSPLKQPHPVSAIPIGRSNTSPIVRATRATTLRQSNKSPSSATKDATKTKMSAPLADVERKTKSAATAAKRVSVPQKGSSSTFTKSTKRHSTPATVNYQNESKTEVTIKPLERQGTFTKDEPEVENAPVVRSVGSSPVKTKIAKPIKNGSPKMQQAAGKPKNSFRSSQSHQSKISGADSTEKLQPPKNLSLAGANKRASTGKQLTSTGKVSANQLLSPSESGKTAKKFGPLGQRSNSNSSIVSSASTTGQNRKLAKEATSKIASLWKKVEESKSKQKSEKTDTRQWITPCKADADVSTSGASTPGSFRLFRSSTFEGLSQSGAPDAPPTASRTTKRPPIVGAQTGVKYRNSCDLSGMNPSDAPCKIPVKSSDETRTVHVEDAQLVLRRQQSAEKSADVDATKRVSRLGSFIRVGLNDKGTLDDAQCHLTSNGTRVTASAIVLPFNYNPKQDAVPQTNKAKSNDVDGKSVTIEHSTEMLTASAKVTAV